MYILLQSYFPTGCPSHDVSVEVIGFVSEKKDLLPILKREVDNYVQKNLDENENHFEYHNEDNIPYASDWDYSETSFVYEVAKELN